MNLKEKKFIFEVEEIIVGISAILLIISAFMTWAYTPSYAPSGMVASSLPISDGMIVLFLGALALVLLIIDIKYHVSAWLPLVIGLIALFISVVDFVSVFQTMGKFEGGKIGHGLYMAVITSLGIVVGATLDLIRNERKR